MHWMIQFSIMYLIVDGYQLNPMMPWQCTFVRDAVFAMIQQILLSGVTHAYCNCSTVRKPTIKRTFCQDANPVAVIAFPDTAIAIS